MGRIFLQHTVPQLLVKGERWQLSKQLQQAVVGRLMHCYNEVQIVSTFPVMRNGGSIERYLFSTIQYDVSTIGL